MKVDVVLLPGLHGSVSLFAPFVALAPPWARCLPFKLDESGEQTFASLATHVVSHLRDADTFVLFAESFSAPIAAQVAQQLREKVLLLVLCNPLIEAPIAILPSFISLVVRWPLFSTAAVSALMAGGDRRLARMALHEVQRLPKRIFEQRVAEAFSARRANLVRSLEAPLLIIAGTGDRLLSSHLAERVAAEIPGAVYGAVSAPHFAAQVAPSKVWALIKAEFERAA